MERGGTSASLRWKILRKALLEKSVPRSSSPRQDDTSSLEDLKTISRRASSHFNMIPAQWISEHQFEDSDVPPEVRNLNSQRNVIVQYKLPIETAHNLVLTQRMENMVNLKDFEISNHFSIDNTGLICSWPSEDILAYFCFKNKNIFSGKKVIELGSGYGLAGFTIAACTDAKEVIISDGNPQVVDYLHHNIKINVRSFGDTKVKALKLHWDQALDSSLLYFFDVVIASDCTFFKEYHEALALTVKWLMKKSEGSTAVILSPKRGDSLDKFLVKVNECGLYSEVVDNYDIEVWERHVRFLSGQDQSWPNYDSDHCYPLLVRLSIVPPKVTVHLDMSTLSQNDIARIA